MFAKAMTVTKYVTVTTSVDGVIRGGNLVFPKKRTRTRMGIRMGMLDGGYKTDGFFRRVLGF